MQGQPNKFIPALWGGVLIGIISGVPFLGFINCACCAGVIGGGLLAVYLYRKDLDPNQPMTMGEGAMLGLLAGLIGAVIGSVLSAVFSTASFDFLYRLSEYVDEPELDEFLEEMDPSMLTGGLFFFGFLMSLIIDGLFGVIGGLLGVSFFGGAKNRAD